MRLGWFQFDSDFFRATFCDRGREELLTILSGQDKYKGEVPHLSVIANTVYLNGTRD